METKKIAASIQNKLIRKILGQRSRNIPEHSRHGECWPQNGQKKTLMWQSGGWSASGKGVPRSGQSMLPHF